MPTYLVFWLRIWYTSLSFKFCIAPRYVQYEIRVEMSSEPVLSYFCQSITNCFFKFYFLFSFFISSIIFSETTFHQPYFHLFKSLRKTSWRLLWFFLPIQGLSSGGCGPVLNRDLLCRHRGHLLLQISLWPVSYTHLTLPTTRTSCRSRWSPYH